MGAVAGSAARPQFTVELWFKRTGAGARHRDRQRRHRLGHPAHHEGPSRSRDRGSRRQLFLRDRCHHGPARRRFRGGTRERRHAELEPPCDRDDGRDLQRMAPRRGHLRRHHVAPLPRRQPGPDPRGQLNPEHGRHVADRAWLLAAFDRRQPAGFFQGQIDEARIWSTARSQSPDPGHDEHRDRTYERACSVSGT